ncbi:uncharacterized protein [Chelonus insularis]|uniref:uncharacterized protein n=1 Tax=Chelonus insularis TaxID=460826 RepID=UPI00158A5191|nr:uncharacterized protein LOC118067303 [Chelonus insularis]
MKTYQIQSSATNVYLPLDEKLSANGIQNLRINVPPMVRSGDSVILSCIYDLEHPLYAIKWFYNEREFYRYVPNAVPIQESFSVNGMKVDISNSDEHGVTLLDITSDLSGTYKCEVSEDYPSYYTAKKEGDMEIVDVPDMDPMIIVEKPKVRVNETLRANCTSGASNPAPNITWTLNGAQLNSNTTQFTLRNRTVHIDRKFMSQSIFELQTTKDLFHGGWLRLRCFATINGIYTATAEYNITKADPLRSPITGDASAHHGKNGCETALLGTLETQRMRTFRLIAGTILLLKLSR